MPNFQRQNFISSAQNQQFYLFFKAGMIKAWRIVKGDYKRALAERKFVPQRVKQMWQMWWESKR